MELGGAGRRQSRERAGPAAPDSAKGLSFVQLRPALVFEVHGDDARLGVHSAIVTPTTGSPAAWIDAMSPAIPQLAELG